MPLFDLTHPLGPDTPVFPGDEPVRVRVVSDLSSGATYTARRVELGTHSGTHVDAPAHMVAGGATVDLIPIDLWVGPAFLAGAAGLDLASLRGVERVVLAGCPNGIPPDWAAKLVSQGVRLAGVDGSSFDPADSRDLPAHRILLGAGVVLIENLRLADVPRGWGVLHCLPLLVAGGDGAPARVLWEPDGLRRPGNARVAERDRPPRTSRRAGASSDPVRESDPRA